MINRAMEQGWSSQKAKFTVLNEAAVDQIKKANILCLQTRI